MHPQFIPQLKEMCFQKGREHEMPVRLNMLKSKHILQEKRAECVGFKVPVLYTKPVSH